MLSICTFAECDGSVRPLTDEVRRRILQTVDDLNDKGFRVLAIAQKSPCSPSESFGTKDERDMVLIGTWRSWTLRKNPRRMPSGP